MTDINEIIAALEGEFYDSKGFLWSKKSLVDVDKCVALIHALKSSIPEGVNDVNYLREEKQRLISSAEDRARSIVEEANQRAEQLVAESEVVKAANFEADRVRDKALKEIARYETGAMQRLVRLLADIESYLSEALSLVRNSREDVEHNLRQSESGRPLSVGYGEPGKE